MPPRLRLVTYNIRKGKGVFRTPIELHELGRQLALRDADVVLCQEVFHATDGGTRQSDTLAEALEMKAVYGPNKFYPRGDHGNATFSRHPIFEARNHDLSTNRIERRGVLHTRVDLGPTTLHVLNTHLGLNTLQRRTQVRRIAEIIQDHCPDGEPLLLGGDFNDWTGNLDRVVVDSCGLRSGLDSLSFRQKGTWPSAAPLFGLDRVYTRHVRIHASQVLKGEPWNRLSDHVPLEVELGIERGLPRRAAHS